MLITPNEGRVCDAVVRHIEKHADAKRSNISCPERERAGPPVDLRLQVGAWVYAIEHTLLQPFQNRIKAGIAYRTINNLIKERFPGPMPGSVRYELQMPSVLSMPSNRRKREKCLQSIAEWIEEHAQQLRDESRLRPWPPHPGFYWADGQARVAPRQLP